MFPKSVLFLLCAITLVRPLWTAPSVSTSPTLNLCELDYSVMFCNCDAPDRASEVTCYATSNNSTEDSPVWRSFSGQPSISFLKFSAYHGKRFNYLPRTMLPGLRETLIRLVYIELDFTLVPVGAIRGLVALEELDFVLCEAMSVEKDAFQELPSLKKLTSTNGNFSVLQDMFQSVPRIEELYLENNQIATIAPDAFSALGSLQYIYLDNNQIVTLTRETFKGLNRLVDLQMIRNKVRHLPDYVFAEMPLLSTVDLSSNELTSISGKAFAGVRHLSNLKLEKNKLSSLPGGAFSSNHQLAILDIAFNEFEHLSWTVFYQPESGRYIRARIKGNSIQCTCSLFWMSAGLQSYDSIVQQELQTIDCKYAKKKADAAHAPAHAQLLFTDSPPKTIHAFITSAEVAKQCKLPSALVTEPQVAPSGGDEEEAIVEPQVKGQPDLGPERGNAAQGEKEELDEDDDDDDEDHDDGRMTHQKEKVIHESPSEPAQTPKSPENGLSQAAFGPNSGSTGGHSPMTFPVTFLLTLLCLLTVSRALL